MQTDHIYTIYLYTLTPHSYAVYRYTANSTHLNRIPVHWKQDTFIPYTGTLQTQHIYNLCRYSANSTHLYLI